MKKLDQKTNEDTSKRTYVVINKKANQAYFDFLKEKPKGMSQNFLSNLIIYLGTSILNNKENSNDLEELSINEFMKIKIDEFVKLTRENKNETLAKKLIPKIKTKKISDNAEINLDKQIKKQDQEIIAKNINEENEIKQSFQKNITEKKIILLEDASLKEHYPEISCEYGYEKGEAQLILTELQQRLSFESDADERMRLNEMVSYLIQKIQ